MVRDGIMVLDACCIVEGGLDPLLYYILFSFLKDQRFGDAVR